MVIFVKYLLKRDTCIPHALQDGANSFAGEPLHTTCLLSSSPLSHFKIPYTRDSQTYNLPLSLSLEAERATEWATH
jgi:hypothetical protein